MSNKDLIKLDIASAKKSLLNKEISSVELVKAHLDEMENRRDLNAFITETPEIALERAKESDKKIQAGNAGILEGIPVGIKDLFCTEGVLTTAASHILDGFKPPYESTITKKLKDAGSVMVGKTNLDEFAMGSTNETSYYGAAKNPWTPKGSEPALVAGGSSGGSASAVSAGLCMAATGTDTGGSIRQPSSFCGITGIKPTYGRCSRFGIIAYASSLDQAGPMARSVADTALMLKAMAGFDERDSTSAPQEVPDFEKVLGGSIKGLKIGIPKEYRPEGLNSEISNLWDKGIAFVKDAGAEVVEVSLPYTKYALAVYYVIAPAECSSNLARYDGVRFGYRGKGETLDELYMNTRAEGFGTEVKRRIMMGTYVLSAGYYDAYYLRAQKVRKLISNDFASAFEKVDLLLTPTAPSPAFAIGDESMKDPLTMWLNDVFTVPASLAGLPAMSLPIGLSKTGLPLGLQLIGRPFDEETVFKTAHVIENLASFDKTPRVSE
ncbi:MAG: Asp-tRNA(Asn)/Glu-tRNA(Gln) amidotransferase subunit GatA [Alphaproteobacteria bacterium]